MGSCPKLMPLTPHDGGGLNAEPRWGDCDCDVRAGGREAEQLKAAAAVLKRLFRQRTAVAWKDWRASVEDDHAASLQVLLRISTILLCTVEQVVRQCQFCSPGSSHTWSQLCR